MEKKLFALKTERLGPLPVVNAFIRKLGLDGLLERFVPTDNPKTKLPYAKGLGILLRSILAEKEPIYRLGEVVNAFAPEGFGLTSAEAAELKDDAVGRALDHLFDSDRGSLLTEIILSAKTNFDISLDEVHNDSTTVTFAGQYSQASGRSLRGKMAPFITYGFSKEHRPDLKQLLFILTSTKDGGIPVQFRCEAGNQSDSRTHEESWEVLCAVAGRKDFLYVADTKLCGGQAMEYIDRRGGRFVTVIPRNRNEDPLFRKWIQTNEPPWEKIWDRPNPRRKHGPRDRWYAYKHWLPSLEGWPVIMVFSELLRLKQTRSRQDRIARAEQKLNDLAAKHRGQRPKKRARHEVQKQIEEIIEPLHVRKYMKITVKQEYKHVYHQDGPGRPGPGTKFSRTAKPHWDISWVLDEEAIAYDHKSDGMYPLLTNDRTLSPANVLEAHKGQPQIEKRFEQTKTVFEIAPVFLKNEGRIEALFFLYFVALLIQALIEREIRRSMASNNISEIPLYPEERKNKRPTAEQIFRLFSFMDRHRLVEDGQVYQTFEPDLTELQKQVLQLLSVSSTVYSMNA
jgi:transposase